ncbi:MAG: VWA domain-containing protein [Planctomycetes bacterium]|nr:VWA domain-containing protein [Planctomycetota bacterium]
MPSFTRVVPSLLLGSLLRTQAAPPPPEAFGPLATEVIVRSYTEAEPWALRAIVLLSLGSDWHPVGVPIVLDALRDKDERLWPYGIELLRGMDDASLRQVATKELVAELVERQLRRKNALFAARTLEVLVRMLPEARLTDGKSAQAWWSGNAATYVPEPWQEPKKVEGAQRAATVGTSVVDRAFDLRDAGLDVTIVIDSTGSMQPTIDTARDAIDDVVALLVGIAPKLRLGLVHYRDVEDFKEGARLLAPLSKDLKAVRELLGKLRAEGGGDFPERVEKGLEVALAKETGWNKDANRMLLVIGDAPAHPEDEMAMLDLVRRAHERPFESGKGGSTGKKPNLRPFVTSTIAIGEGPRQQFERIASVGGGAAVTMTMQRRPAAAPAGKARDAKAQPAPTTDASTRQIVEHILLLSFGASFRPQLERFVRTFFEYRDAGLFR